VAHGDDDVVEIGSIGVHLLHTPGHTPGSQCFVVGDNLVSGDTLFLEGCGRTDLPGADADDMYASLQRLGSLPGRLTVWPGHHYSVEEHARLDDLKRSNPVLARLDRESWRRLFS
jgi:glyoxylase-like metal-dependent hydrolase (beta-lactamase superfamily II)